MNFDQVLAFSEGARKYTVLNLFVDLKIKDLVMIS